MKFLKQTVMAAFQRGGAIAADFRSTLLHAAMLRVLSALGFRMLLGATCALRGQERITVTGKSAHTEKTDNQRDTSPYPCSPAAPKGNTNTVNELRATRATC